MPPEEAGSSRPGEVEVRPPLLNRLFDLPATPDSPGVRWARPANHMQRGIARGGVLYRDERSLTFLPRGIDAVFGAREMSWELSTITDVTLKPTLRKLRLTITTTSGKQRFIVSQPAVVFNDLSALRKGRGEGAPPIRSVPAEEGGAPA